MQKVVVNDCQCVTHTAYGLWVLVLVGNTLRYYWHQLASFISVGDAFEVSQSCNAATMSGLAAVS